MVLAQLALVPKKKTVRNGGSVVRVCWVFRRREGTRLNPRNIRQKSQQLLAFDDGFTLW